MRRAALLLVLVALSACGGAEPQTQEPTQPSRPELPDDWRTVATDEGDVVIAIPPEMIVTETTGAVMAVVEEEDGAEETQVWVIGPGTLEVRPGQSMDEWVEASMWLTGQRAEAELGPVRRQNVALPSGPAIEMTAGYTAGGDEAWTILYVIDTPPGFAVFRVGGPGPPPDDLPAELVLIRDLAAFPSR